MAPVLFPGMKPRRPEAGDDPLVTLQLQVARRADVIARGQPRMPGLDLHCWLLAEREVLGEKITAATLAPHAALAVTSPAR